MRKDCCRLLVVCFGAVLLLSGGAARSAAQPMEAVTPTYLLLPAPACHR
jgi:hypothetical protein